MNIEHVVDHKFIIEISNKEEFMELYDMCMGSVGNANEKARQRVRDEMYRIKDALVCGEEEYQERIRNF